jgi:hypothetical protein
MHALLLGDPLHRLAELLHRDPGLVLDGGEGLDQRRRQHPAEVRDHRGDLPIRVGHQPRQIR